MIEEMEAVSRKGGSCGGRKACEERGADSAQASIHGPAIYFVALEEIAIASALLKLSLVLSRPLAQGVCTLAVCTLLLACGFVRERVYCVYLCLVDVCVCVW